MKDRGENGMLGLACWVLTAMLFASAATPSVAQPARYPSRTIEIVVAYGGGGGAHPVARALPQRFPGRPGPPGGGVQKPPRSGGVRATPRPPAQPHRHTPL